MGVAKVDSVYAMFIQCGNNVLVAESTTPDGEFKWARLIDMTDRIGTPNTGDQTVFTDNDTGKSYLICSKGKGRDHIYVAEIGRTIDGSVGLVDCTEVYKGAGREGNCMFKYGGKYYLCASNLYGWDCSYVYFLVAEDVKGPYREVIKDYKRPKNEYPSNANNLMQVMPGCEHDYAHLTQTGFFTTIRNKERELVIYCGDRWANFAGNGLGYNQWIPLSFDGDVPHFNSLSSWQLDTDKGTWSVASDNNYVMNGSFEADRSIIPLKRKPCQDFITGWEIEFIKGNKASVEDDNSPRLNYNKTKEERTQATGEKALLITDIVDFKRRVSQVITSTTYIPLPSSLYKLTAKVKSTGAFRNLYLYAKTAHGTKKVPITTKNSTLWQCIMVNDLNITDGEIEIGIFADGKATARCLIDDVELVKQ